MLYLQYVVVLTFESADEILGKVSLLIFSACGIGKHNHSTESVDALSHSWYLVLLEYLVLSTPRSTLL